MRREPSLDDVLKRVTGLDPLQRRITILRMAAIFDSMGLPLPEAGAFLPATDGLLVLLNDHGLVLRFEATRHAFNRKAVCDHPLVLQPLGRRAVNVSLKFEVLPGTRLIHDIETGYRLFHKLEKGGVSFFDMHAENIGIVSLPDREIPVVIDRGAVEWTSRSSDSIPRALTAEGLETDPQCSLYGTLREAFDAAWLPGASLPDPDKMQAFMSLAREMTQQGVLVAGWSQPTGGAGVKSKTAQAGAAAIAYGRQRACLPAI